MTVAPTRRPLDLSNRRYFQQNAQMAVHDISDALVELATNCDDAYERVGTGGRIDIEVERRRKGVATVLRVRDFAGGLRHEEMVHKLGGLGDRHHSGLAAGADVRGTNSRGAKDVSALGPVTFESITADGNLARCGITPDGYFDQWPEQRATKSVRDKLGIPKGTGTVVTIEIDPAHQVPQHETLERRLAHLVPLRDILADPRREVYLHDLTQGRVDRVQYHAPEGVERISETIKIPGYPDAQAKLVIKRAKKPLENRGKFREGGILVKSRKAVHEATLFAPELDTDPHAARFFGRVRCEYIDELWNEWDARKERGLSPDPKNPILILDPSRQGGLRRDHPFFEALKQEVLKRLRPLVEEERKNEAAQRADVENKETRRKLNELEKLATRFMNENQDDNDDDRDNPTNDDALGKGTKDYVLSPPYAQIILGRPRRFYLTINQEKHPELAVGSMVQIQCETDEISTDRVSCPLEVHPTRDGLLRCVWAITGQRVTKASGVVACVGSIVGSAAVEVLASERDIYSSVVTLQFWRKRYRLRAGAPRTIRLLAPCPGIVSQPTVVRLSCADRSMVISGDRTLYPRRNLGIAECKISVTAGDSDHKAILVAEIDGHRAETELISEPPEGDAIRIEIKDVDYKDQRSRWEKGGNKLIIAARHPSIRRYLGPAVQDFPGQDRIEFQVLLAEIVAYAVCEKVLTRNVRQNPDEYRDADLDTYLSSRDALVTKFLPVAHNSQVPESALRR